MASADQISCRNLGRQSWASALTGRQGSCIDHPGQRRTAKRMRCGREGWAGIGAEIIPKVPSNAGQSLSHGEAVPAPVVPKAWPPPIKFRAEIWGVGQVVGPYGRSIEVPATGRCGHRPLRVRWLGPSGAELQRQSCGCSLCIRESFSSGREKRTRGQGLALPPRVLMGIAYFWQVLRKR